MHFIHRLNGVFLAAALSAASLPLVPRSAGAVDINTIEAASLDQPAINALLQPVGGGNPYNVDPTLLPNWFTLFFPYLDTGTSGIVISSDTAALWNIPIDPTATFSDIAVGGNTDYFVSQNLNVRLAPSNATDINNLATFQTVYNQAYNNIRIEAGPFNPAPDPDQLGGLDVFGMPVLMGKTMVSDARGLNDGSDLLRTYIYNPNTPYHPSTSTTDPGIPTTSNHVQMSYGDFSRFTQLSPTNAVGPVFSHNPFIGPDPLNKLTGGNDGANVPPVSIDFQGLHTTGSFLFDTGAQVSFISQDLAAQLHVRYVGDSYLSSNPQLEIFDPAHPDLPGTLLASQFSIPISGIGGNSADIAGFYLDSLTLHTIEGSAIDADPNNIHFSHAAIYIYDITLQDPNDPNAIITLDGDFGTNFLFGSQSVSLANNDFNFGDPIPGNFNWVTFDETSGILGLDVVGVPEPGSVVMAASGALLLAGYVWRRRRATAGRLAG